MGDPRKDRVNQDGYAPELSEPREQSKEKEENPAKKARRFMPVDTHGYIATGGSGQPKVSHNHPDGSRSPIVKHGPDPKIKTRGLTLESLEEHPIQLTDQFLPGFVRRAYIKWEVRFARWRKYLAKKWPKF
jgi:hypothetical protein